ncbi:hypothetical protein J6590_031755 [Homalodisca vitripennis]|nr:hypothetical protein J6590_031755 [Homalodisca vitripennis]
MKTAESNHKTNHGPERFISTGRKEKSELADGFDKLVLGKDIISGSKDTLKGHNYTGSAYSYMILRTRTAQTVVTSLSFDADTLGIVLSVLDRNILRRILVYTGDKMINEHNEISKDPANDFSCARDLECVVMGGRGGGVALCANISCDSWVKPSFQESYWPK